MDYLSKKVAALRWFKILVTSGPTRKCPNWGLLWRIDLKVWKSLASCSGETDLLKWSIKWFGSKGRIKQTKISIAHCKTDRMVHLQHLSMTHIFLTLQITERCSNTMPPPLWKKDNKSEILLCGSILSLTKS